MPRTLPQKAAIEEIIHALLSVIRSKRPVKLAAMFMDLVDRTECPVYYDLRQFISVGIQSIKFSEQVIPERPEPRCLKIYKRVLRKGDIEKRRMYTPTCRSCFERNFKKERVFL